MQVVQATPVQNLGHGQVYGCGQGSESSHNRGQPRGNKVGLKFRQNKWTRSIVNMPNGAGCDNVATPNPKFWQQRFQQWSNM